MANYLVDQGICLRVADFSETSQIATLFTAHHGLVHGIAKGAKRQPKPRKKDGKLTAPSTFTGPLDLLSTGQIVFIMPKRANANGGEGLATLTAWQLEDHHTPLRQNLAAIHAGVLATEITLALLHPFDDQPVLFTELQALLSLLQKSSPKNNVTISTETPNPKDPPPPAPNHAEATPPHPTNHVPGSSEAGGDRGGRALVGYIKQVLAIAGYQPHLHACLRCQTAIDAHQTVWFSPRAGGVLCASCRGHSDSPHQRRLSPAASASSSGSSFSGSHSGTRAHSRRGSSSFPGDNITQIPGLLALALERLASPSTLLQSPPDRPADPAALRQALDLLLDQVQSITDKPLKTRWLVDAIFK